MNRLYLYTYKPGFLMPVNISGMDPGYFKRGHRSLIAIIIVWHVKSGSACLRVCPPRKFQKTTPFEIETGNIFYD